jgi:hypothetical protein
MAAARFAGLMRVRITFLGFRASALHPRLYSAARIRGLKMRTSIWRKSLGNDKLSTPPAFSKTISPSHYIHSVFVKQAHVLNARPAEMIPGESEEQAFQTERL